MSIEGQGHFFTIYFPGFVCFVLYLAKISGERLQDHWSSGFAFNTTIHVQIKGKFSFFPLKFTFLVPKFLAGPLTSMFRAQLAAEDKLLVFIPEMFCSTVGQRIALLLRMGIGQCYLRSHLR